MKIDISSSYGLADVQGFFSALVRGEALWYDDICMGIRYAVWGGCVYIIAFDCWVGELYFIKIPEEKLRLNQIIENYPEKYFEELRKKMREIFEKATDRILEEPENPDNTLDKAILEVING